jgi:hypothetical protein
MAEQKPKKTQETSSKMIGPVLPPTMIGPSLPSDLNEPTPPGGKTIIGPVMPKKRPLEEKASSINPEKQSRNFTPMTKEEWEKRQSVVRRVYDEASWSIF